MSSSNPFPNVDALRLSNKEERQKVLQATADRLRPTLTSVAHGNNETVFLRGQEALFAGEIIHDLRDAGYLVTYVMIPTDKDYQERNVTQTKENLPTYNYRLEITTRHTPPTRIGEK